VLRFGEYKRMIGPGLSMKWPWPIETVEIPVYTRKDIQGRPEFVSRTVTGIRTLDLGKHPQTGSGPILWTNDHVGEEVLFLVQPDRRTWTRRGEEPELQQGGSDLALLAVEIPLHYSVADVRAYEELAPIEHRDDLLKAVARRAVMQYLSTLSVNDLLGARRNVIQPELRARVERAFAELTPDGRTPINIHWIGIQGVHPPKDVAGSFENVIISRLKNRALLVAAESEATRTLTRVVGSVELAQKIVAEIDVLNSMRQSLSPEKYDAVIDQQLKIRDMIQSAGGAAAAAIAQASAERWRRHMSERAALAAYQGQLGTYKAAPHVYRASLYLDAMKTAVAESRLYIADPSFKLKWRLGMEDRESVSDIFSSQEKLEY
jgi:regulator of protease activity HflC (stomatin/prohibitin superfamily)